MKYLFVLILLVCLVGCGEKKISKNKYPNPTELKRSKGVIHHPSYGDYPETVEFSQGMTLMPGQSTELMAVIEIPTTQE